MQRQEHARFGAAERLPAGSPPSWFPDGGAGRAGATAAAQAQEQRPAEGEAPLSAAAARKADGKMPESFRGGGFGAAARHQSRFSFLRDCSSVPPSGALLEGQWR